MTQEEWESLTWEQRFELYEAEAEHNKPIDPMFMDGDPDNYDGYSVGNGTCLFEHQLNRRLGDLLADQPPPKVTFFSKVVYWFWLRFTRQGRAHRKLERLVADVLKRLDADL